MKLEVEDERITLAIRDGFSSWDEFEVFWIDVHLADQVRFDGDVIHWQFPGGTQ